MEKEIKKPDKFKIKVKNNNGKEIIDFLIEKGYNNGNYWKGTLEDGDHYGFNNSINIEADEDILKDCKEYTLEEFKKLFESQFEVGKWYKSNIGSMNDKSFYYLKVINIVSNCYLKGERIKSSGSYEKDSFWDHEDTLKQALELGPLTDLSEIQQYLPEGHPDKINEFKEDDYIVITYSDFRMVNFSINYIYKQRNNYNSLSVYKDNVNVENGYSVCSFDNSGRIKWRYATKEEIDEYNRLNKPFDVTTLNTKKYDYEVVHCTTQEEWDFVLSKYNPFKRLGKGFDDWKKYGKDSVIFINSNYFTNTSISWCKDNNVLIYSFQEWCDKFNHKPDFNKSLVGRYLKILKDNAYGTDFKLGEYVKIIKENKHIVCVERNDYNFTSSNFKGCNVELMPEGFIPKEELTELPEKWIPKVGDYIYANANIKGYGPQVTKIDRIYWESDHFYCVCKFKHLDGTLHPCLNTNWNYQIDNINRFLRPATKEEIYNYEKEQLLKKGEPIINNNSHEWFIGNNINKIITSPIELQEVNVGFSEIEKAYEKVEYQHQQLRENPLTPKESYNIKKLPTKSWY